MFLYNSLKDILLDIHDEINYCLNNLSQNYLIDLPNLNQAKYKLFENAQIHYIKINYDFNDLDDEFTVNPAIDPVIPRNKIGVIGALCLINKTLVGQDELTLANHYQYLINLDLLIQNINQIRTNYVFSKVLEQAKLHQNDKASPENLNKILLVTKKWLKELEK